MHTYTWLPTFSFLLLFIPRAIGRGRVTHMVKVMISFVVRAWWCHQMETFSKLLALSEGNSPVTGEFPSQRPVTQNFDIFFDLRLNKHLSKQSRRWWFETQSWSLWRHCNGMRFYPYITLLLHRHWGHHTIVPVSVKQPWWFGVNTSRESTYAWQNQNPTMSV